MRSCGVSSDLSAAVARVVPLPKFGMPTTRRLSAASGIYTLRRQVLRFYADVGSRIMAVQFQHLNQSRYQYPD